MRTDVIQSLILAIAICIILFSLIYQTQTIRLPTTKLNSFFSNSTDLSQFSILFLFGLIEHLRLFCADQTYIQRFISLGSVRKAQQALWISLSLTITLVFILSYMGCLLADFYTNIPTANKLFRPDFVLIHFSTNYSPSLIGIFTVSAIFVSAMSSLDSSLNSSSILMIRDVMKKPILQLHYKRVTLGISLMCLILSQSFRLNHSLLDLWWSIVSIFGSLILSICFLSFFSPTTSDKALKKSLYLYLAYISCYFIGGGTTIMSFMLTNIIGALLVFTSASIFSIYERKI